MSDEEKSRMADIRIVRAEDSTYYRVDVKFLGHITAAIRWDDREEEGRADVLALLKDSEKILRDAFTEIDVERGGEEIDADLAALFAPPEPEMHQPVEDEEDEQ